MLIQIKSPGSMLPGYLGGALDAASGLLCQDICCRIKMVGNRKGIRISGRRQNPKFQLTSLF
jgi:hypothetical protein